MVAWTEGSPRLRWEENIRIDLKGIGINTINWVDSAQHRDYWRALVSAALNFWVIQAMELVELNLWLTAPKGATPVN